MMWKSFRIFFLFSIKTVSIHRLESICWKIANAIITLSEETDVYVGH